MRVLGIETSCDDTGVAIYCAQQGLVVHKLASQLIHNQYGGVVPELAARDHIRTLLPLVDDLINGEENAGRPMDGVAYTSGPGLAGALMVGSSVGRSLAMAWGVPAFGVHHMEGHLLAPMLESERPEFPFIALLVSGGHTLLVDVCAIGEYQILGSTLDDAAGEAFDKTAKLLGLGYPGGPAIAKLAQQGNNERFQFPRPMINRPGLDFSFSGLKTEVRTTVQQLGDAALQQQTQADVAVAFEAAVVDTLTIKCKRALTQHQRKRLVVAGGVGANLRLRESLKNMTTQLGGQVFYPSPALCTDNGAMIALAGYFRLAAGQQQGWSFEVTPRWSLEELPSLTDKGEAKVR